MVRIKSCSMNDLQAAPSTNQVSPTPLLSIACHITYVRAHIAQRGAAAGGAAAAVGDAIAVPAI